MEISNIARCMLPLLSATPLFAQRGSCNSEQWKAVDATLGRSGQMQPGGVYMFDMAGKVNPVVRALQTNGTQVTAMHNHMLGDEPHLYSMHFSAHDDEVGGLRAALDATNSQRPQTK
jgi:hypothetical protein